MGKTDPEADMHRQQSMVLVPMDTPGVELVRNITTMNHHSPEGHSEVLFRNVRVPVSNLIAQERKTFGKFLYQHGAIGEWIARSRIEIEQARLLVLKTASLIDRVGPKVARKEISTIKVIAPTLLTTVAHRAMQVFGAMGVSPDTPLADFYTGGRVLRYADGPDEVHLQTIARLEIKDSAERRMDIARYMTPRQ